jgi:hypothetical protein
MKATEETYVRVTLLASWGLREMMDTVDSAPRDDKRPILVDARALQVGPVEHALMGDHVALMMPTRKIAVVIDEARVSYNSERAAQRAHVNLRVFTDEPEALAWLGADADPKAPA